VAPPPPPTPKQPEPKVTTGTPKPSVIPPKGDLLSKGSQQPPTKTAQKKSPQPNPVSEFSPENDADSRVDKLFAAPQPQSNDRGALKTFLFVLALGMVVAAAFLYLEYF
jgi:hypothetical protein